MKRAIKTLFVIIFIFILVLISFSPLLPKQQINFESNVPISLDDILFRCGSFYFTYIPKKAANITHTFLRASVSYEEQPFCNIKFDEGLFGATSTGIIIEQTLNDGITLVARIKKSQWNENFAGLFCALKDNNLFGGVDYFIFYQNYVAFFDKNGILNIIGNYNFGEKVREYVKTTELLNKKLKQIKTIDLRFNDQSVIIWR